MYNILYVYMYNSYAQGWQKYSHARINTRAGSHIHHILGITICFTYILYYSLRSIFIVQYNCKQ